MALRPNRFLKKNAHPAAQKASSEWNQGRRVFHRSAGALGGLGVLLLGGAVLVRFAPDSSGTFSNESSTVADEARKAAGTAAGDESSEDGNSSDTESTLPSRKGLVSPEYPSLETLRKEAEANPHGTPPTLRAFARGLAPWMRAALAEDASVETIGKTVELLTSCATPPAGVAAAVRSARLLCLLNLQRLGKVHAERHPTVVARIAEIVGQAPEDFRRKLELAEKLGEGRFSAPPAGDDEAHSGEAESH